MLPHFEHQKTILEETWNKESYALFWEQGCAKTRPAIDTAARLLEAGEIDAMLVVSLNGVHRQWIERELPKWATFEYDSMVYEVPKGKTKKSLRELQDLIRHDGFVVLSMPISVYTSQHGKDAMWKFLKNRRCLYVLDESHKIKGANTKTSKAAVASAKYAPYRRILTGTPYLNSPFDYYPQMRFLDEDFWKKNGFPNLACFKAHFSITQNFETRTGQRFQKVVAYRNEEELAEALRPASSRLTKLEALPWLPERTYVPVEVPLSKSQRELYDALTEEYLDAFRKFEAASEVELAEPPPDPMTTLLRLQQVVCGYYPTGDEEDLVQLDEKNPRVEAAVEICDNTSGQVIIWARFTRDIENLLTALGRDRAARYDGKISAKDKERSLERFRNGDVQVLVMNQQAGGTGLTLNEASTTVYFSNSYSLGDRLQSEARNHRAGQKNAVTYYDLIAPNTVDEQILAALRGKIEMAATLNGDDLAAWLEVSK